MQEHKINPYTIHPYIIDPTGTGTGIVLIVVNRYCSLILYSCTTASLPKSSQVNLKTLEH